MGPIIDLTTLFPWRIISIFALTFTSYNICHSCLKDKRHPLLTFILVFLVRLLCSLIFYNNIALNALGYTVYAILYFLALLITTEGSVFLKVLCSIFLQFSTLLSSLVMGIILFALTQGAYPELENSNYQYLYVYLTQCIIIIVTGYIFTGILKLIKSKKTKTHRKNKTLFAYLTFFPVSHILVVVLALVISQFNHDNAPDFSFILQIIVLFFMALIIIFDCFYPFIIDRFEKLYIENEQQEKLIIKNKLEYEQTKMLAEEKDEFRKLKHDFLNLLSTIKGFIEIGKYEKALSIIKSTQKDVQKISGIPVCSNETINTVLFIKQQQAEKLNIKFEININETALLKVDNYSICRVMHNMLDNAINAVSQADNNIIKIHIDISDECFIMEIENYYVKTTKNNIRKGHGNGIHIIKEIAKTYIGNYSYITDDNLYIAKIELQNVEIKH